MDENDTPRRSYRPLHDTHYLCTSIPHIIYRSTATIKQINVSLIDGAATYAW